MSDLVDAAPPGSGRRRSRRGPRSRSAVGEPTQSPWPSSPVRPPLLVPLLAHVAGMLAGYGVLVLVGLMARVPVLEHGIGADRMTRWHRVVAPAVMALIVV